MDAVDVPDLLPELVQKCRSAFIAEIIDSVHAFGFSVFDMPKNVDELVSPDCQFATNKMCGFERFHKLMKS
jgi:hypothetical protein